MLEPPPTLSKHIEMELLSYFCSRATFCLYDQVVYKELPFPADPGYGPLWEFLRAGGFDVATDTVRAVLKRAPLVFEHYIVDKVQAQRRPPACI